jgi:hypothetical protein
MAGEFDALHYVNTADFLRATIGFVWRAIAAKMRGLRLRLAVGSCANVLVNTFGLVCAGGLSRSKRITYAGSWSHGSDQNQCIA